MASPLADRIYQKVKPLPEPAAREVLDFVEFIAERVQTAETRNLMLAQSASNAMQDWENADDEIWNERPAA